MSRKDGQVYLIISTIGLFKIGSTIDLDKRIKTLRKQRKNERLFFAHTFEADDRQAAEISLLASFDRKRYGLGDWFVLSVDDIDLITRIAKYENGEFIAKGS